MPPESILAVTLEVSVRTISKFLGGLRAVSASTGFQDEIQWNPVGFCGNQLNYAESGWISLKSCEIQWVFMKSIEFHQNFSDSKEFHQNPPRSVRIPSKLWKCGMIF